MDSMARSEMRLREDLALERFCERLELLDGQPARVIGRPDRDSPGRGGCDAIVERNGIIHAVEHTTIDTFPGQRADDARYLSVLWPVADVIRRHFPDLRIMITVGTFVVHPGTDWKKVARRFRDECLGA